MIAIDCIIPVVWAVGLLGSVNLFSKDAREKIGPEYFFPAAGFAGLFIYILGLVDAFAAWIFVIATIFLFASAVHFIVRAAVFQRLFLFIKHEPLWFALILVILAWYGIASISFPVSGDALYFHLGLPKLYARAGKMFFTPNILSSASPRTSEMITTAFFFLGVESGAQLFVTLIAAFLVWAVWSKARDLGGFGGLSAWVLLSVPIFVSQIVGSKNDFLLWGLSFFAAIKYIEFEKDRKRPTLIWCGIAAGMAAGTKAVGLALFGPFAILMLLNIVLGKDRFRDLVYFTLMFLLFSAPWYIHSWVVTGNPLFPYFDNIFHSPLTSAAFESFNKELAIKSVDHNFLQFLVSPLGLIFEPGAYDGRLGYTLLVFPALLLFVRRVPRAIKTCVAIALVYYVIWFWGFTFARFLLPMGALLAVAASFFFIEAIQSKGILRITVIASLAIAVILPIPTVIRDTAPRVNSVLKGTPQTRFLSQFRSLDPNQPQSAKLIEPFSYIYCWQFINRETPPDSRIGILSSFWTRDDGYYLNRDYFYLNPSEQKQYDFLANRLPGQIAGNLEKMSISFIVLDSVVTDQFSPSSPWARIPGFQNFSDGVQALDSYCRHYARTVYDDGRYRVYKIAIPPVQ